MHPDLLIGCLGCPKQEKWIYENYMKYDATVSVCAGATVDFLAGNIKRAPRWMSDHGLEWFYRFLQEPKRMFGKDIKIKPINAIRGKLEIQLQKNSKLKMGVFLMTTGPCYIKIIENAKCSIGDKVFMNHNCSITCANEITIGDNCNLANNIVIVDHDHNIGDTGVVAGLNSKPIHIGNNVWIGANVTILKGVTRIW